MSPDEAERAVAALLIQTGTVNDRLRERLRKLRRDERERVSAFVRAVAEERSDDIPDRFEAVRYGLLPRAFRALAPLNPSPAFRREFLNFWLRCGDSIRGDVNDDLALLDGLWALLPSYRGNARRVYRAESIHNHRYRTYGMSWSEADDLQRMMGDPGVLLECLAPPQAIVCRVAKSADRYGEREVIIDRRKLTTRPRVIRDLAGESGWTACPIRGGHCATKRPADRHEQQTS